MDKTIYRQLLQLLKKELVPSLGCTEPVAIAYAAALAAQSLGTTPERMTLRCSGNVIKNVKGVAVPNSGGMKGMEAAAVLGAIAGNAENGLEVLAGVTPQQANEAQNLVGQEYCTCFLAKDVDALYVCVCAEAGGHVAEIVVEGGHTNVTKCTKDGVPQPVRARCEEAVQSSEDLGLSHVSMACLLEFANTVDIGEVREILDRQIEYNTCIAREGLANSYGANVGKTILQSFGDGVRARAVATAAAGSDARMSGCRLPVVINSGSGNQGMTVSLPIIEYGREQNVPQQQLYRALVLGNLVALYQKNYIGYLSAYCGAVCAAAGAVCGIAYLRNAPSGVMEKAVTNTICTIGGMVCDGAKPSCASKIAVALHSGMLGLDMALAGDTFLAGEGLVQENIDQTIMSVGRMAKQGMAATDTEILNIMMGY